jgi:hypothetical protein
MAKSNFRTGARDAFVSDVPTYCSAPILDPDTYDTIRDECGSTSFTVTRELWDSLSKVVVGDAVCNVCGAQYLFCRLATREEEESLREAPMHLVLTSRIDWP